MNAGAVYQAGYLDQGPIVSLFQTKLAAQRRFPEEFFEAELFDRRVLADVTRGEA